jgi:hypothetical protein
MCMGWSFSFDYFQYEADSRTLTGSGRAFSSSGRRERATRHVERGGVWNAAPPRIAANRHSAETEDVSLKSGEARFVGRHCSNSDERCLLQLAAKKLVADHVSKVVALRYLFALGVFGIAARAGAEKEHGALLLNRVNQRGGNFNHDIKTAPSKGNVNREGERIYHLPGGLD